MRKSEKTPISAQNFLHLPFHRGKPTMLCYVAFQGSVMYFLRIGYEMCNQWCFVNRYRIFVSKKFICFKYKILSKNELSREIPKMRAVCHNSQSAALLSSSGLVMYFSTLPAPSASAPCILTILTHLRW